VNNEKSLGAVLAETREEMKEFVETRLQLLRAEIREMVQTWKYSVPLLLVAAVLLMFGWGAITFALVALVRGWFLPSALGWVWAGLIIGALYLIAAIVVGWFAYAELREVGVTPKRTLQVLKQDQVWIQNEARTI